MRAIFHKISGNTAIVIEGGFRPDENSQKNGSILSVRVTTGDEAPSRFGKRLLRKVYPACASAAGTGELVEGGSQSLDTRAFLLSRSSACYSLLLPQKRLFSPRCCGGVVVEARPDNCTSMVNPEQTTRQQKGRIDYGFPR